MRRIWWGLVGAVTGLLSVAVLSAQGPFSAQIQAALRAFVATNQTITGTWTFSTPCVGCGGSVPSWVSATSGTPALSTQVLVSSGSAIQGFADFTRFAGLGTPGALTATLVATGTGNIDAGAQTYKVTFVDENGNETAGGASSNTVTTDGTHKQIALSNIPLGPPGTVARQIYRQDESAMDDIFWSLHCNPSWTLNDNTTTIYTDNIAYASTCDEVPATDSTAGLVTTIRGLNAVNPGSLTATAPDGTNGQSSFFVATSNLGNMSGALIGYDSNLFVTTGTSVAFPHSYHANTYIYGTSALAYGIGENLDIRSTGTISGHAYGINVDVQSHAGATWSGTGQVLTNVWLEQQLNDGPTLTETSYLHLHALDGDFSHVNTTYGLWVGSQQGRATNAYSLWFDTDGVYRVRTDHTFDNAWQSIPALYNPQFTKYSPGATDYERCVPGCQWESNVAVITTEVGAGGGNVLRDLKIGDAGAANVELGRNTFLDNGLALRGDTTAAHTWLLQSYDTDTGPAYVTFATVTNGTAPSFVLTPPAGGATVSLTASALSTAGTTAVAVANVGPSSCGTTAATIAGNDTIGEIVVGATAGTQCRVTFTVAAAVKRDCVVTDGTTTIATRATYVDSTHTDFLGAFVAGDTLNYVCMAR